MATQAKNTSLEGAAPPAISISQDQFDQLRHLAHVLQPSSADGEIALRIRALDVQYKLHAILDDVEEGLSPAQMRQSRLEGVLA